MMIKDSLLLSAPTVKRFRSKKNEVPFGPTFGGFEDKYGFNIKFEFYDPQKAHLCVISRLLSYCA